MTATQPASRYRWMILALVFFATTINYIDRQILSLLKPMLDVSIGWTNTQYGWVNSAFQGAYAIGLLWFGSFVDRAGVKRGYQISIIGWSVAAILHAPIILLVGMSLTLPSWLGWLANPQTPLVVPAAFVAFLVARVLLGLFEGGNFPAAIKAVTQWFPRRERALATSLFNAGTNVGAIFAPALVPPLAYFLGWPWAFVLAGIAGLLWLLQWGPKYDSPERRPEVNAAELAHIHSDPAEAPGRSPPWQRVLCHRQAWSFITSKFLTDPVWWFFLSWLPDFFKKTRGLDIKNSWVHLVTIYVIITVLSIGGGWLSGLLINRGWSVSRARKTGMLCFASLVVPIILVSKAGDWQAVLLSGLAGSAHQAWSATLYTTVSDMFPKRAVATLIGIGGMAGAIGGMIFQVFVGSLLDRFAKLGNASAGYATLFGICAGAYLLAFVINHLLAPKFEPLVIRE
ncbi:MAG: MFS transporter [Verrucomicrobia bacterium]|nr:MAG: MFS transporter [Verrucomicrobiota bacterium]